jgi:general secretion pathway protein E
MTSRERFVDRLPSEQVGKGAPEDPLASQETDSFVAHRFPDPSSPQFADQFGEALIVAHALDTLGIERARRAAMSTGERLDIVLTKLGLLLEADVARHLARYLKIALYSPGDGTNGIALDDCLTPAFILQNRILPIRAGDNRIVLCVVDPFDSVPLEATRLVTGKTIDIALITQSDFDQLAKTILVQEGNGVLTQIEAVSDTAASEYDLQRLRDSASEAPVVRLVSKIIADAVDLRASDIHLEPTSDALNLRYRIDGMLRTIDTIPERTRAAVLSRIKIVAKMDIAERRLPQDGRIKIAVRGNEIDFRIATIPTVNGESVVMRVLDRSRVQLDFPHLGFEPTQIEALGKLMSHPNGIVLVTGPTGSGKTTTLYTALKQLNQPHAKIFTVEDPIEYQLAGISQVQVQQSIGLDFPACLRSILRQDPDMIMIGEIRDAETARIAVQASLTGHLVFSTLHTNSAAATVTRLIDMGIEHFLLGSTLRGIMGQRLVRRLCSDCKRQRADSAYWTEALDERLPPGSARGNAYFCEPVGCSVCHGTGFRGRLAISELMLIEEPIQNAILNKASSVQLAEIARSRGMRTIYEDGIVKAWSGSTTVEEVLRVTDVV